MTKLCVDLCSGLGGFSAAFKDSPDWEVVTVDNEPKFNPTVCADITKIDWNEFGIDVLGGREVNVLLASPPCERFSVASHTWPRAGIKKAMEIVGACFEAVAVLKPKYWLIENPMGRLRWFLGTPQQTIRLVDFGAPYRKLTDLWGDISLPMVEHMIQATHYVQNEISDKPSVKHPLPRLTNDRAAKAKLPLGLSQAILEAVE